MKVYMTRKNADMIEGRGPMVNDVCFEHRDDAAKHIDRQQGVMGRLPPSGKWSTEKYGDWEIVEIEVHSSFADFEIKSKENLRKQVLEKLSPQERKALGY